ncbi:MAG: hypothetical protein KGJ13_00230 [Patescibacteria group bacterium]|nr:hypothetical protein [Patescibacteria group bacterium]
MIILAQVWDKERRDSVLVLRGTVRGDSDDNLLALQNEVKPHRYRIFYRGHGEIKTFDAEERRLVIQSRYPAVREHALPLLRRAYPRFEIRLMHGHP